MSSDGEGGCGEGGADVCCSAGVCEGSESRLTTCDGGVPRTASSAALLGEECSSFSASRRGGGAGMCEGDGDVEAPTTIASVLPVRAKVTARATNDTS